MALPEEIRQSLTLPAFAAPMFLCSGPDLAAACCKAGIVGSLTRNHCRDTAEFENQLKAVHESLQQFREENPDAVIGPLAANITPTHFSDQEFVDQLKMCLHYGATIMVTAAVNPSACAPIIKDFGLMHFHDVTNIRFAEKAIAANVDGLVAIGAGGGGHSGTISHLALIPAIRRMFDGVLVMAGAVSDGAAIRAAEILGADLAYMGTRFIATKESAAPDAYKAMLVESGVTDVWYTPAVNGHSANWLLASLRSVGLDPANMPVPEKRGVDHLPKDLKPWKDIWSGGQGVGLIDDIPHVEDLVVQLQREYIAACEKPDMAQAARAALERS